MSRNNKKSIYKVFVYVLVCACMSLIACNTSGKTELEKKLSKKLSISNTQKVPKLYLIGGFGGSRRKNDVWNSDDSTTWKAQTDGAEFSARNGHQVVLFNGKLYLIGGSVEDGYTSKTTNEVWSSEDGVRWKEETPDAEFSARYGHRVVVFQDRMYLIGGATDTGKGKKKNDVWSSSDGKNWKQEIAYAKFSARSGHQVVLFKGKIYLIGGYADGVKNDVWSSSDGKNWIEEITADAKFSARSEHQVVVFRDKMYLIGGMVLDVITHKSINDVWSSSDGENWEQETTNAEFSARSGYQVVPFQDRMYLIGGLADIEHESKKKNDIWSSSDGENWEKETTDATFSPRSGHQVVVFPAEAQ